MKRTTFPSIGSTPTSVPFLSGRLRIVMLLGTIGLAGIAGYELGQSGKADEIQRLKAVSSESAKKLTQSEGIIKQCRQVLNTQGTSFKPQLQRTLIVRESPDECPSPDEAQCDAVMKEAALQKALEWARILCVYEAADIEKIRRAMEKGYSELKFAQKDHYANFRVVFFDPKDDSDYPQEENLFLEKVECIPDEYLGYDHRDDPELAAFREKTDNGDFDAVVQDLEVRPLCPEKDDIHPLDSVLCNNLADLQDDLATLSDRDERQSRVCDYLKDLGTQILNHPDALSDYDPTPTPEEELRSDKLGLYIDSLVSSVGLTKKEGETDGELFAAILRCALADDDGLSNLRK